MNKNRLLNISVIGFFTILIATAAPAFARSDVSTAGPWTQQERFVVNALKQIYAAQAEYLVRNTPAEGFRTLETLAAHDLIDENLGAGRKFGYVFILSTDSTLFANFRISAMPAKYGKGGRRSFYFSGNCLIRGADKNGAPATEADPIIDSCDPVIAARNDANAISSMIEFYNAERQHYRLRGFYQSDMHLLYIMGLMNPWLASGTCRGYNFEVWTVGGSRFYPSEFRIRAQPSGYGSTGIRSYYVDHSGILRGADRNGGQAGPNDPPIVF